MARAYVERQALRKLGRALRMSEVGRHARAIDAAKQAVALLASGDPEDELVAQWMLRWP